jgi:hypothetical protein
MKKIFFMKADFLELKDKLERNLKPDFELLELNYLPYAFGSGLVAYRKDGRSIKLIYDGKEQYLQLFHSGKERKYPSSNWKELYSGPVSELEEFGIYLKH